MVYNQVRVFTFTRHRLFIWLFSCLIFVFAYLPQPLFAPPARVIDGLLVLYAFDEGSGSVVQDVSGIDPPLNLDVNDLSRVSWQSSSLIIDSATIISSAAPASKIIDSITSTNAITIEAWITPSSISQSGPARIVSLSATPLERNFTLGQQNQRYDSRLRTTSTSDNGRPSLNTANGIVVTLLSHVVYTRNSEGVARLYVDGAQLSSKTIDGNMSNWNSGYRLLLGNEATEDRPWFGEYSLVAIYSKALTSAEVNQNFTAGADPGPSAPVISNINVNPSETAATITWNTDIDADSTVAYGETTAYELGDVIDASLVTNHTVSLVGLSSGTDYHFKITSATAGGALAVSSNQTFTTLGGSDPPLISVQPLSQTVNEGGSVTFTVEATGSLPLLFQWQRDGSNILGATNSSFTLSNVSLTDDGALFQVVVSNILGDITTSAALLTVTVATRVTADQVVLYQFDEGGGNTIQDVSGVGSPLALQIADTSAVLWEQGALQVTGTTTIVSQNAASKIINAVKNSDEITVEAWITPSNTSQQGPARIVTISQDLHNRNVTLGQDRENYDIRLRTTSTDNNGRPSLNISQSVTTVLTHVVYTRDSNGVANLYINNSLAGAGVVGGTMTNWNDNYLLGIGNEMTGNRGWLGTFHLLAIYSRALSISEVGQNYDAGIELTVDETPPTISNIQILNVTDRSAEISWDTDESASSALDYGLTTAFEIGTLSDASFVIGHSILLNNLIPNSTYYLRIRSSDAAGNEAIIDDQTVVTLADTTAPVISSDQVINITENSVVVTWSTDELANSRVDYGETTAYGGSENSVSLVTEHSLTLTNLLPDTIYHFQITSSDAYSNEASTLDTSFTTLAGPEPPAISVQPLSQSVDEGSPVTFSVVTTGTPPLSYQWFKNGAIITGETGSQLTLSNVTLPDSGATFYVDVSNSLGQVTSDIATLTVNDITGPIISNVQVADITENSAMVSWITTELSDSHVDYGLTQTYSAGTASDSTMVTNHGIALVSLQSGTLYHFQVRSADSSANEADSGDLTFTTQALPSAPIINTQPASVTIAEGQDATFMVLTGGTQPLNYQWQRDGADIVGATNSSYTLSEANIADDGSEFQVVITNSVGSITSSIAVLSVSAFSRVILDQQVLYTFEEGSGNVIEDVSNVGEALNLQISDTAQIQWQAGALQVTGNTLISSVNTASKVIDSVVQSQEISVEAWITPLNTIQSGPARIVSISLDPYNRNMTLGQDGDAYDIRLRTAGTDNNGRPSLKVNGTIAPTLSHVVYTRNSNGLAKLYVNNILMGSKTVSGSMASWNSNYKLAISNELTADRPWLGTFHLVAIYSRALFVNEIEQNYQAGVDASVDDTPPVISNIQTQNIMDLSADISWDTDENASSALDYGLTTAFEIGTLSNASLVSSHSMSLSNLVPNSTYYFRIRSSDAAGNEAIIDDQTVVTLADTTEPVITNDQVMNITENNAVVTWSTDELANSRVDYGETTAYGGSANSVSLVTEHSLTLASLLPDTIYHFQIKSSDAYSNEATTLDASFTTLTGPEPPTISTQPVSQSVDEGSSVTFSIVSTGTPPLSYQWFRDSAVITGEISSQLTLSNVALTDSGAGFYVVVGNSLGQVTSDIATLTVNDITGPIISNVQVADITENSATVSWITIELSDSHVDYGLTQAYSAGTASDSTMVTNHSIALVSLQSGTLYHFQVRSADSSANEVDSGDFTFTTQALPSAPIINTQPASVTIAEGQDATFTVLAGGTQPLSYQWLRNGGDIAGETSSSYTLSGISIADDGSEFQVVITNSVGSLTSTVAVLSVSVFTRVTLDQQVLYTFEEGSGNTIQDLSGVGELLNLQIANTNRIQWQTGALQVTGNTLISTSGAATKVIDAVTQSNEISVEAWITPINTVQSGPARIVSLSQDPYNRNMTMGQDNGAYDIRLRSTGTDNNGRPSLNASGTIDTSLSHVVYTRNNNGAAKLYVNSTLVGSRTVSGVMTNWDGSYKLSIANELTGDRHWLGTFHLVAIYSRALSASEVSQNYQSGENGDAVSNQQPVASFTANPVTGEVPLSVSFDAAASYDDDGTIASYSWNFGDGNSATGVQTAHNYMSEGQYSATLTVTDDQGVNASMSVTINVVGGGEIPFAYVVVDPVSPGDPHTKTTGDINGDGFPDLLVGSAQANDGLYWYEYPNWTKHTIVPAGIAGFTTDMQVADVDNDGDLDVVIPKGVAKGISVWWYENPRPAGNPALDPWLEHFVGDAGAHDVEVGDINNDNKVDIVVRETETTVFIQNTPDSWSSVVVSTVSREGIALGDIDLDNDLDIVINGRWLENPQPLGNLLTDVWVEHVVDLNWPTQVAVHIVDVNNDNRPDIAYAPSEDETGRFSWYEAPIDPKNGVWIEHIIDNSVGYIHTFKSGDIDADGDVDFVTSEMEQSQDPDEVSIYRSIGNGSGWSQQIIATTGSHNIRLDDIDNDGDLDIFGVNWKGLNSIDLWRNELNQNSTLKKWKRHVIDMNKPWRAIFVEPADIDNDGLIDIVTGAWWYKNPGEMTANWPRNTMGGSLNNMATVYDFDGDGDQDVLGTEGVGSSANSTLVWAQNNGSGSFTLHANIDSGNGDFLQGVSVGRFLNTDVLQVALSWHNSVGGTELLTIPTSLTVDQWTRSQLSTSSQGEELSQGDIDNDGDNDLLLGTQWLRNEQGTWTVFDLFTPNGSPDRNRLVDINNDGNLDAVVGYETDPEGLLAWYEQTNPVTGAWAQHVISSTLVNPHSLDVGDLDGDGDLDVVVGEHNTSDGTKARLFIFENLDGNGGSWQAHVIYTGDEHHDGTQLADFDGDGDLDIVSIGWNHDRVIVYENQGNIVRFAVIGDYGIDSNNELAVANMVKRLRPQFITTVGDNRYNATPVDDAIGKYYGDYIGRYLGSYGSGSQQNRFFPSFGNHDWLDGGGINDVLNYFTLPGLGVSTSGSSGNERYYDFVIGNIHFFMTDTQIQEPDGITDTSVQALWLQTQLAASQSTFKLVFGHHPPYSSSSVHGNHPDLQWPYQSWGATAVLSGHDHTYERIEKNGFTYFVNGLGGRSIYTLGTLDVDSQLFYSVDFGAMIVIACETSITFKFYSISDGLVDSYSVGNPVCKEALQQ